MNKVEARILSIGEIQERLERTEKGKAKNNRKNARMILEHDPMLAGAFCYNILSGQVNIVRELWYERNGPALTDMDLVFIMHYIEEYYELSIDKNILEGIELVAQKNKYHPIRDFLNALEWDGTERIRHVLHHFLGAPENDLTYECMKMFLMGAIERVFHPGCKFEYMLCLVGGQGIGKSSFFHLLAMKEDWFLDDLKRFDDENVYRRLRGHWLIEISEMVATARSKSIEETKSFISRQKESYKDLYAKFAEDRPRQCVFGGTTNNKRFLPFDRTGNRRFLPVQCDRDNMEVHLMQDVEASRKYLSQVWAEAMDLYRKGAYSLAFSKEVELELDRLRLDYMSEDTEAGKIQAWLDDHQNQKVCSMMLYKEVIDRWGTPTRNDTDRICEIMNSSVVGWEAGPTTRFPEYGTQRSWVCVHKKPCSENPKLAEEGFVSAKQEELKQIELLFADKS